MSPTFNIPSLIPPLPSSSNGKENMSNSFASENHAAMKIEKSRKSTSSTSSSLSGSAQETPWRQSIKKRDLTTPPIPTDKLQNYSARQTLSMEKGTPLQERVRRSVLRIGEKVESLFCLSSQSPTDHVELAHAIASGSKADDPAIWLKVLGYITKAGQGDMIRVYRRATLRFPLNNNSNSSVLQIWLSFASLQAQLNLEEEARSTFRYIENQCTSLCVSFYLDFAAFEQKYDKARAMQVLGSAIVKGVQPTEKIHEALDKLKNNQTFTVATTLAETDTTLAETDSSETTPTRSRRQRSGTDFVSSPKRQKLSPASKTPKTRSVRPASTTSSSKESHSTSIRQSIRLPTPDTASKETQHAGTKKLGCKRPSSRLSSRLIRKGLSGKAKRVEADTSVLEASDSETEVENPPLSTVHPKKESSVSPKATVKFKKMDLSYMWDWDPNAREKTVQFKHGPSTESSREKSTESVSVHSSQSTHSSSKTSVATPVTRPTTSSADTQSSLKAMKSAEKKSSHEGAQKEERLAVPAATPTVDAGDSEINQEFLPLVHENNILRVNGTPYAKLGVIGKGGSCKVYRALSKKCSVVAIKKVKLEGMDQSSIDGYANEISLLKRLRGNPAIIQLHDSEVDLARKSIFLVMEVGEADLNHILQQRSLAGKSYSLNMHFIRLTWQQMLSAVHCIHEERIIHSDLKPANFLFVRGALKLIDFGIAKAIQSEDTTNIYRETHIGTLNYMSPEAILDTETDEKGPRMKIGRASDVWSLGCILYEMIYGRTPFAKLHFIQKLQAIVNPNHKIHFPEGPNEDAINAVKVCLRRNPENRPPIVGNGGLLNEHRFLHPGKTPST